MSVTGRSGRGVGLRLMTWGPIPPSGGPYRDKYLADNGRSALRDADEHYAIAMDILGDHASSMPVVRSPLSEPDRRTRVAIQQQKAREWAAFNQTVPSEVIEKLAPHITRSETSAVAAFDFLEDHELAETAHAAIHRAAFVRSGFRGCPVYIKNEGVWTNCSMQIHQNRVGVSMGIEGDFECSICGLLVEDCDAHTPGHTYSKIAARAHDGKCNICDGDTCTHVVGESYPARAVGRAKDLKVTEASFVARPRYPMARIVESEVSFGDIGEQPDLVIAVERGELHCQECFGPCEGLVDFDQWMSQMG